MAGVVTRLLSVLESVISKLARYDEGSILGSILSFTVNVPFRYIFYLIILFQLLVRLGAALLLLAIISLTLFQKKCIYYGGLILVSTLPRLIIFQNHFFNQI